VCSVKQQPVAQMEASRLLIIIRTNSSRTIQTMPPVRNFSPPPTSSIDIRNCHTSVVLSSTPLSTSSIRSVFTSVLFVCLCAPDVFLLIPVRVLCFLFCTFKVFSVPIIIVRFRFHVCSFLHPSSGYKREYGSLLSNMTTSVIQCPA
jgi:hypothetical protein